MTQIPGPTNQPPDRMQMYRNEFSRGLDIFQESLKEYQKADEMHKKAKLKDVMDKALHVLNETASKVLKEEGQKNEIMLNDHYKSYLATEDDHSFESLNQDIEALRRQSK